MATNRFRCYEGLIQKCTQTHTTKSGNIQLVLGPGRLSLKFYKQLVRERRKLQTEVVLVLSSDYIYAVSFGNIMFGSCIIPLGPKPKSANVILELYRWPQNSKINEKHANFVSRQVKQLCENILLSKMMFNIWVCVMVWWPIILSSKFCSPHFPRFGGFSIVGFACSST